VATRSGKVRPGSDLVPFILQGGRMCVAVPVGDGSPPKGILSGGIDRSTNIRSKR